VFIKVFVLVPVEKGVIGGWSNSLTSGFCIVRWKHKLSSANVEQMLMLLVLSQVSCERHQKFKEYLEGKPKQQQCGYVF
jgi:hypothetical protein